MNTSKKVLAIAVGIVFVSASLSFAAGKAKKGDKMVKTDDAMMMKDASAMKADEKMPAAADKPAGMDKEAMMAKWKEYATPNENHRVLDALVGEWSYTQKNWMSPDAPAEESTGSATNKWVKDGRFVEQDATGTMMSQKMDGTAITGYDNAGKEYQTVWMDNMGTGMMMIAGSYDPATKTLTQSGNFNCPFRGKMSMKAVTKFIDANSYSFEMWGPDETGKEFKGMEIVYKKVGGAPAIDSAMMGTAPAADNAMMGAAPEMKK